jgi:type 1 glutamine amidotransferase
MSARKFLPMKTRFLAALLLAVTFSAITLSVSAAGAKKIVIVAGKPSHGPAEHEFRAGALLLKSCLDKLPGYNTTIISNGWPTDTSAFDSADAIVLYMDGGNGHPAIQDDHLAQLGAALKHGAGLACLHYAVEVPATNGGPEFLQWLGGYFEINWSVNPMWQADFKTLPDHPITRGVKPFTIRDEWYYHMRFADKNVTPILTAVPPDSTREKPDDPHGGNPYVRARKGMPEVTAWAFERADGGRGFGITGSHYHKNWGNDDFRKLVLNAIVWIAKGDVPPGGVESSVTPEQLSQNLDPKPPKQN